MKVMLFRTVHVLLVFCLCGFASCDFAEVSYAPEVTLVDTMAYNYDRLDEVKKSCSSVIHSALDLKLKLDDEAINMLKNELSFFNGNWEQQGSSAPIMPFDDKPPIMQSDAGHYSFSNYSYYMNLLNTSKSPYKLVSFKLADVSRDHQSKKTVGVSGFLSMVITSDLPVATVSSGQVSEFSMWKGHSQLYIDFQGVYAELKKNGGERVLCLLGSTLLPSRQPDAKDPWEWVKASGTSDPTAPLLQDDQILLMLHIPKSASLKHMTIEGEMRSLNPKLNLKYFDKVKITSQMKIRSHHYDFSPDEIVAKACNPYPYSDTSISGSYKFYEGLDFCSALMRVSTDAAFTVSPHWRCNGTDEFCRKFGPFGSDEKINATDGSFKDVRVLIQDIFCISNRTRDNGATARVSAVFRAYSSPDNQFIENMRSGLSSMTLVAEGKWNSSSGQLCMIGCPGTVNGDSNSCDFRICLYIPLSFSLTQRSVLIGSISSVERSNTTFSPLSLEVLYQSFDYMYDGDSYGQPYYQYSKIDAAGVVLEKDEPFSFGIVIKKSLLTFPKLQESEDYANSLRLLAEDLTLHVSAVPDPLPRSRPSQMNVEMEVLSLGPMFGRYWFTNASAVDMEAPYHMKAAYTEKQLLLNVSTQLKLRGGPYSNFSVVFLEGLYDQHVGKMYLIGCRDVRASWTVLSESMGLANGLDCLIEVTISYPPTTARWLVTPTASISISSQRVEDDPLYFKPLKIQTLPILYRQQRDDILSRRGLEGILKILTLSITIACISSQLFYTTKSTDSLPYMSLAMMGTQAIGFALPLVIGAEAMSRHINSENSEMQSYDLQEDQWIQVIDYIVKLLVLACFILTLRLCQRVWNSRLSILSQSPSEPTRVPSEKRVLVITMIIHIFGYLFTLTIHSLKTGQTPIWIEQYVDGTGNPHRLKTWETLLQEYIGLLQDFFLLPQVIGNIIWQINSKPLRNLYYMGITFVRLLPHVYDYVRGPVANPYFSEQYEFVNRRFDFYSEFGDITILVLALAFAVIVFIQQRWSYDTLSKTLTIGHYKLLPSRSRAYERLPSQSVEAELVGGPSKGNAQDSGE